MTTTMQSGPLLKVAHAVLLSFAAAFAWAQETPPATEPDEPPTGELRLELEQGAAPEATEPPTTPEPPEHERYDVYRSEIIRVGSNAHLAAEEYAEVVMSVFGSVTSEGRVQDSVISVFGDAHVTGPIGDAAVAVFGDAYIDSEIGGDVVVVFGNLELGQHADIGGDAMAIGGTLNRHPDAIVRGAIQETSFAGEFGRLRWLRPWVEHGLLLGRPLAIEPGLNWAWWLAFGFLAFYMLIATMFGNAVERCVQTFETRPGETTLASIITVFLSPIFIVLLSITVIGVVFVPFFLLSLFIAGLFGKAVVLATLGRRITRASASGPFSHLAVAVLIGGLLVTAIYLVPVIGFIAFNLLGILSLGVVAYTLLLAWRTRSQRPAAAAVAPAAAANMTMNAEPPPPSGQTPSSAAQSGAAQSGETPPPAADSESPSPATDSAHSVPLNTQPRADFWVRMGALAIDAVLVAIVAKFIPGADNALLLTLAIYGALMWKLKGTTIGGIICNLRVVRIDGRNIDWATSIVRALGCILSLVVVGLGFIWIALDPERQAWHDKIAGTVVVRVPKGMSLV